MARTADFIPLRFVIYLPFNAYAPMAYALTTTLLHPINKKNEKYLSKVGHS